MSGLIFGALFSFITSWSFVILANRFVIRGIPETLLGEPWLYYATIVPFILTFSMIGGYFSTRKGLTNRKLWIISAISAFFITLYSGTVGAIFGEHIIGNYREWSEIKIIVERNFHCRNDFGFCFAAFNNTLCTINYSIVL